MNNKVLSNKGFEIITNILWVLAIVSMIGLLIVVKELSTDVKDIRKELIQYRK
jgi:hypothetical protein